MEWDCEFVHGLIRLWIWEWDLTDESGLRIVRKSSVRSSSSVDSRETETSKVEGPIGPADAECLCGVD